MKGLDVGASAETAYVNVRCRHSRSFELVDVCAPEIEVRTPAGLTCEPAIDCRLPVTRLSERRHHFFSHLPAACAEGRSDGDDEILGPGAV